MSGRLMTAKAVVKGFARSTGAPSPFIADAMVAIGITAALMAQWILEIACYALPQTTTPMTDPFRPSRTGRMNGKQLDAVDVDVTRRSSSRGAKPNHMMLRFL